MLVAFFCGYVGTLVGAPARDCLLGCSQHRQQQPALPLVRSRVLPKAA
jgi:hypothetical protein